MAPSRAAPRVRREHVFDLLVVFGHGCADERIARQLGMRTSAVSASLTRASRALGASSSAELVDAARRLEREDP